MFFFVFVLLLLIAGAGLYFSGGIQEIDQEPPVLVAPPEVQQGKPFTESAAGGMKFVFIPGGKFQMGSPPEEKGRDDDEDPVHEVYVDSFWMGKYEVTNAEYVLFLNKIGKTGTKKYPWFETEKEDSFSKIQGEVGRFKVTSGYEQHPVNNISWYGAIAYIDWLNGKTVTGRKYRLPTEAEWEYAVRAGTSTVRHWGDHISCDRAMYNNYSKTDNCAEYIQKRGLQNGSTAPVGSYPKNQFGIHDMLGNVWEWCADWYDSGYYAECKKQGLTKNPAGSATGSSRVIRGGGWSYNPRSLRSASRTGGTPDRLGSNLGFRLVLPVQQSR